MITRCNRLETVRKGARLGRSGFTLIELVVSLAITSVIALFVFSFATSLAKIWRTTEGGVSTELDVQVALDTMAKDLESAIFEERGISMFAVNAISKDGSGSDEFSPSDRWELANAARPSDLNFSPISHRYGWGGIWLRFIASSPSVNAIAYQIVRRPAFVDSGRPIYLLHRSLVRQDKTLEAGFDLDDPNSKYFEKSGLYDGWASEVRYPRLSSAILEDVIDFGVRLYVFDETSDLKEDSPRGLRLIFPASISGVLDEDDREHLGSLLSGSSYGTRYPEVVEIFVRVLDDVGSDLLIELEEGESQETYDSIVEKHGKVYRRMIRLPGREPKGYDAG